MNNRRLIDYLPPALHTVPEFAAITDAQQPEIEEAWSALRCVMDNQFIDTATEEGVSVWEKELNITPLAAESLEERKKRIIAAWTCGVVYTYNRLVDWLKSSCGETSPAPTIDNYTLRVALPISADYVTMLESMRRSIAVNMQIAPTIVLSKAGMMHYAGAAFRLSSTQTLVTAPWDTDSINLLTDENGIVLMEEAGSKILYEEVIV